MSDKAFRTIKAGIEDALDFANGDITKGRVYVECDGHLIPIELERGEHGLIYATSPEVPGLFIAAPSVAELLAVIPNVMQRLER